MKKKLSVFFTPLIVSSLILGLGCARERTEAPSIRTITSDNVHGVIAVDEEKAWIVGGYGQIYHTPDAGSTWVHQKSGVDTLLIDGCFVDPATGWIVGIEGVILHTRDGGENWERQDTGTDKHLFSIHFIDNNNGWAAGEWNTILRTHDGGETWQRVTEEEDKILNHVFFTDTYNGWAVGEAGIILNTVDRGDTWTEVIPEYFERETLEELYENPRPAVFSVYFSDMKNGWICGMDGLMLRTTDAGKTWQLQESHTEMAFYSINVQGDRGWAVGDRGTYALSRDGGETWQIMEDSIKSKMWFRDVSFSSPANGFVVGMGGTVVHSTDGGETWEFYSGLSYDMDFFQMPRALEFGGGRE